MSGILGQLLGPLLGIVVTTFQRFYASQKLSRAKPSKEQIARARAYINSMDWKFARTMPQWPHCYVFREDGSARDLDFLLASLKNLAMQIRGEKTCGSIW